MEIAQSPCDFLVSLIKSTLDFGRPSQLALIFRPPLRYGLDCLQPRLPRVMITTGQRPFLVRAVSFHRDSIDSVTAGILSCNSQIRAYHSLTKDVLKGPCVHGIEVDFLNDGDHVVGFGNVCAFMLEPIERHEGDTASPLSL